MFPYTFFLYLDPIQTPQHIGIELPKKGELTDYEGKAIRCEQIYRVVWFPQNFLEPALIIKKNKNTMVHDHYIPSIWFVCFFPRYFTCSEPWQALTINNVETFDILWAISYSMFYILYGTFCVCSCFLDFLAICWPIYKWIQKLEPIQLQSMSPERSETVCLSDVGCWSLGKDAHMQKTWAICSLPIKLCNRKRQTISTPI